MTMIDVRGLPYLFLSSGEEETDSCYLYCRLAFQSLKLNWRENIPNRKIKEEIFQLDPSHSINQTVLQLLKKSLHHQKLITLNQAWQEHHSGWIQSQHRISLLLWCS